MSDYQLPCECGRVVTVSTSQAGDQIDCSCGITLEVPNLRGMRQLKVAAPPDTAEKRDIRETRTWSRTQGVVFAIGMFCAVVGAGMSGILWKFRSEIKTSIPEEYRPGAADAQIDQMSADQSFGLWQKLRDIPLTPPTSRPPWVVYEEAQTELTFYLYLSMVMAALGVVTAIVSFVLPGDNYSRVRKRT